MGKRLCLIGGSGFVGRAIVHQAVQRGYEVTVACRHPERARDLLVDGARLVKTDIVEGKGLSDAVAGANVVVNLVGLLYEKGRYTFEAAHVHGTEHVIEACREAGIERYLHMSALGAGDVPESRYAATKAEAEERVVRSGLHWTIFRPSIIYGRHDSFFNKFKKMGAGLPVMPLIAPEARFQPVWVEDVARAFVMSVDDKRTWGQTYVLVGPKKYSFRQLIELMNGELGRQQILLPLPDFVARMIALFTQWLPTPVLTTDQLILLKHDNVAPQGVHFPELFGEPADLERVLPTFIHGDGASWMQRRFNELRRHYRKGSL
ncbi:MAG: complex I NDUFA9 subunit family protein [Zetaproteobacteria bacterium]|nr:MAG: complex I NDUFA9 subunit family protein [Zetaproteobacteria bacterium]